MSALWPAQSTRDNAHPGARNGRACVRAMALAARPV
jgi:hypothetical protein